MRNRWAGRSTGRLTDRGRSGSRVAGDERASWWAHRRTTVAIVYGTAGEPIEVLCDAAGDPQGLRFFTVVLDDAEGS